MEKVARLKRALNLTPLLQIVERFPENTNFAYICQLTKFGALMHCGSKDYSKMHPALYTNTHHDVKDLENHKMVKNKNPEYLENRT